MRCLYVGQPCTMTVSATFCNRLEEAWDSVGNRNEKTAQPFGATVPLLRSKTIPIQSYALFALVLIVGTFALYSVKHPASY
jgi:hypothetical protein